MKMQSLYFIGKNNLNAFRSSHCQSKSSIKTIDSLIIEKSRWIRAQKSGLFHLKIKCNQWVEKGEILATITDPY